MPGFSSSGAHGVFCYVNSVFAPGLDEGVGGLWRVSACCFYDYEVVYQGWRDAEGGVGEMNSRAMLILW